MIIYMYLFLWSFFMVKNCYRLLKNRYTGEWLIIYMYLFLWCFFMVKRFHKLLVNRYTGEWLIFFCLRLYKIAVERCKTHYWRLEDVFKTYLQDVLEDEKLLRWRRLEDVLEINKMFTRISVLIHGLLRNLNQYLTNLYLTNLYFMNLRRIQNALIRTQQFLYLFYFETQSAELFQNRYYRTDEAIKMKF